MKPILFRFILVFIVNCVVGQHNQICENSTTVSRSCTTQILGEDYIHDGSCKVEVIPPDSAHCTDNFGPISSNAHIGGVSLRPYLLPVDFDNSTVKYSLNHAVLNITFSNIKWKTMKFRFQKYKSTAIVSYCRNIILSNDVTFNDQSVLYYDCYWALTEGNNIGQSHILDFEATNDGVVNRGRYYFNMPSADMLSPTITEVDWKPFVYIEIFTSTMRLHIVPPPFQLHIPEYKIEVMWENENGTAKSELVKVANVKVKNRTSEVTYDYSMLKDPGAYYFNVQPMHDLCKFRKVDCKTVKSPKIKISKEVHESFNICIASITALIVATLFAYYIVLRVIRRYWCKEYAQEIPPPTKVLVVYSPANRLHAECVASFVTYLRSEYGFEVMYDGDISNTAHGDPFIWAQEAFNLASHVIYIVGPMENTNLYNNIYDKPILAHKDVDVMLLSLLKGNKVSKCPKDVMNVFFEHSNGPIPVETKHDKVFFLLKDWQKLIAYLSRNLLPKRQLMRTEKGKNLLDDLTRAKKLLSGRNDDVIVKCDMNSIEKKVLL
ncbi:uncharacterized protein LOC121732854 isoform X2 [Aricia agestis]|uniref:uncharacterized protein LOC121732854 isoform X2 n=1 Tax=Aricia agestis TaxID=91739 RepID=UPI001C209F2A|nr:uncharacterized protein LOC121732854 isoform X2 [Aricia agestis]